MAMRVIQRSSGPPPHFQQARQLPREAMGWDCLELWGHDAHWKNCGVDCVFPLSHGDGIATPGDLEGRASNQDYSLTLRSNKLQ